MTPGQAQWGMWLFGAACGWLAASMLHRNERLRLRDALERLVRALDTGHTLGTWAATRDAALRRARDVLGGVDSR